MSVNGRRSQPSAFQIPTTDKAALDVILINDDLPVVHSHLVLVQCEQQPWMQKQHETDK